MLLEILISISINSIFGHHSLAFLASLYCMRRRWIAHKSTCDVIKRIIREKDKRSKEPHFHNDLKAQEIVFLHELKAVEVSHVESKSNSLPSISHIIVIQMRKIQFFISLLFLSLYFLLSKHSVRVIWFSHIAAWSTAFQWQIRRIQPRGNSSRDTDEQN
jgi:hypothetical protein